MFYKLFIISLFVSINSYSNCLIKILPDSLTTLDDYILAAKNYKQLKNYKSAINILNIGLAKYDSSGLLFNELGEVSFLNNSKKDAINFWEKGILLQPKEISNYFNAAKYYQINGNHILAALYSEVYILLASNENIIDARMILLDSYQKIISSNVTKSEDNFLNKVQDNFNKSLSSTNNDLKNSFTLLRYKFLLNWFSENKNENHYSLFNFQNKLAINGLFSFYNNWLFQIITNPNGYKKWCDENKKSYTALKEFLHQNKLF